MNPDLGPNCFHRLSADDACKESMSHSAHQHVVLLIGLKLRLRVLTGGDYRRVLLGPGRHQSHLNHDMLTWALFHLVKVHCSL